MKLHLIVDYDERNNKALEHLRKAADDRNLEVNVVETKKADYFNLPALNKGDLLYRHGLSKRGVEIERLIINDDVAHFYNDTAIAIGGRTSSYFYNVRAGLPVIKTIPLLPSVESNIQEHVDYLGGFPLIVKVMGGSVGVGVVRVDTIESLKSCLDFVRTLDSMVLLREYIPHKRQARLVVVGDEVVSSFYVKPLPDEFRTNVLENTDDNKEPFIFSEEVQKAAVEAVHSIGLQNGGVDVLFADDDSYSIPEVNFPCNFVTAQRVTEIDVAGKMVDWLMAKSRAIT